MIKQQISTEERDDLKKALLKSGLELLDDKKAILIEKIKNVIVAMIHYTEEIPKVKYSEYLSEQLNHDYTYLANQFSESTSITIEHFIITHKIERAKELIIYNGLNMPFNDKKPFTKSGINVIYIITCVMLSLFNEYIFVNSIDDI